MKNLHSLLLIPFFIVLLSCSSKDSTLTEAQQSQIIDSAKQVVEKVLQLSNNLDFQTALNYYSEDEDARYIENGYMFSSMEEMRSSYAQFGPTLEELKNSIDKWNTIVLSKDAVLFTLPFHFSIKAKGLPKYTGQYLWTAIVQKRNNEWKIVHTHESWANYAEAVAALTPPEALAE